MKKRIKPIVLVFYLLSVFLISGLKSDAQVSRHRLIFNCDGTDLLGNFTFGQRPLSIDDLNAYVDTRAHTQVTTFMTCSGSDFPNYRSKYGRVFGDDLNGTLDCGCDTADYRIFKNYYTNFLNIEKEGTDIIAATLKRTKKDGMEAFISYRMNDLHFTDTTVHCPIVYSDFWRTHPQYWLNEDVGWHSRGALNFAYKEVRRQKLNMITEQLEKYGTLLDGYDLDFMRFIVYFKSDEGQKNSPLITEMVKDIKAEVDKQSAKYGKKILLSVRVPTSLDDCMKKGLDVKEWIRQGLIDFVSIGVHFIGNPSTHVAKFKKSLENPNIPVYTTIEGGGYSPREFYSHGMYRGMASHILAQGGDGIYLFNHFFVKSQSLKGSNQVCRIIVPDLLKELGSLETLRHRNKIYCLDNGNTEYGLKTETPLPLAVSAQNKSAVSLFIGDNPQKDKPKEMVLFIRTSKPAQCSLWVNGVKIEKQEAQYIDFYERKENLGKDQAVYAFILPALCLKQGENEVSFQSLNDVFKVKRLEVLLKYGDVKTNGYF